MREDRSVWRCEICSDSAFNNGVSEITSNREVFLRRTAGSASSSVSLSSLMQETTEQTNTVYRRHPLGFALRSCWVKSFVLTGCKNQTRDLHPSPLLVRLWTRGGCPSCCCSSSSLMLVMVNRTWTHVESDSFWNRCIDLRSDMCLQGQAGHVIHTDWIQITSWTHLYFKTNSKERWTTTERWHAILHICLCIFITVVIFFLTKLICAGTHSLVPLAQSSSSEV